MKIVSILLLFLSVTQSIHAVELNHLTDALQMVPDATLVYKTINGRELHLYAFHPQETTQSPSPTLLAIHGGGWKNGEPRQFFPHARYFALRGIPAFSVEYRLVDTAMGTTIHDCVSDSNDAVTYIRNHAVEFGIDPERIAVMGDSSGGHLAACTGTLPPATNRANAVINCNGIMDLTGTWISNVPDRDPIVAASLSPLFNISSNTAPMLHIHGLADIGLSPQTEAMHTALTNSGIHSELHWLQDAKHAFILPGYNAPQQQVVEGISTADRFLASQGFLIGAPTLSISTIITTSVIDSPPKIILGTNHVASLPLELQIGTTPSVSIEMEIWLNSTAGTIVKRESYLGFNKRGFNLYFDSQDRFLMGALGSTKVLSIVPSTGTWHNIALTIGFSNAVLQIDENLIPLNAVEFAYPQEGRFLSIGEGLDGQIRNVRITAPFLQTTNGTPIAWLEDYALSTDASDPDADGFQTLEEYVAVTNPTNGLDYLRLGLSTNGLAFGTASNRNYEIMGSDNLTSNHWKSVTNLPGTGTFETLPFSTNRFYRLNVSMP